MSATNAVAFVKDPAGRYVFMNDRLIERLGDRVAGDPRGLTDADLWPPEVAAATQAGDEEVRATDGPIHVTQVMPMAGGSTTFLVTKFPIHTPDGVMIGGLGIDWTEQTRVSDELARSQALLALATEVAGIGVWEFDGAVRMANTVTDAWDIAGAPVMNEPTSFEALMQGVHPDDRQLVIDSTADALRDGGTLERDFRVLMADGQIRWIRNVGRRVGEDGTRLVGISRDVTDELASIASMRDQATILRHVEDVIVVTDPAGLVSYWNAAAERLLGRDAASVLGLPYDGIGLASSGPSIAPADGSEATGVVDEHELVGGDGERIIVLRRARPMYDEQGRYSGTLTIMTDITERKRHEHELLRLSTAVEQSADSIVITDANARIQYVNPAFEATTGYSRAEVVGQNPRILKSGVQSDAFYSAMWAALSSGQSWVADMVNRRKDGSRFEEEAVISPIRDADGAITSYLAVKRNVTRERALEAQAVRMGRERALISDTLAAMRPQSTVEETAQMICKQVASLTGVAAATILRPGPDGRYHTLGGSLATGETFTPRTIPLARSRHLLESARRGPWVEAWVTRPWHPYNKLLTSLGATSTAFASIQHGGESIGIISIASAEETPGQLTESLPALVEFAGLTAAMIGPRLATTEGAQAARTRVADIVFRRAFTPVFQPIVELTSGRAIGYEALTRFDDGAPPDEHFLAADAVGLGIELEIATLRSALHAAAVLGPKLLLNINVSPALVMEGTALRALARRFHRRLVLEITEHTAIDDYEAFHRAVRAIGPGIRLAVDDAGAGFASFRHILELRPAFVKLDRSLVAGIDSDPAKQALAAGMRQFAHATHCLLIAEGVETEAERAMLLSLEIHLAQGYLLGRPGSLVVAPRTSAGIGPGRASKGRTAALPPPAGLS